MFGSQRPKNWKAAPLLGEGNSYVFGKLLGFSEAKIRSLVEKGIVG
jgi:crotonobetainyl-CoA:carnitine CoA-transferase CaiB-like acyl-CoA transferase